MNIIKTSDIHISRSMMITLVLSTISLMIPMSLLTQKGYHSLWCADTLIAIFFIVNFIITNRQATHPIVHFHTLFSKKPFVGATMAISSHLTLLTGIAGINVYIVRILKLPFDISLHFYFFFLCWSHYNGYLKMFFYSSVGAGF